MSQLTPLPPLHAAPLFPVLHGHLITLLRTLTPAQWDAPTVAGAWRVRDVVAHLLDGDLRKLSAHRDGHLLAPDRPITGYADVVALIQQLNAGGVAYGARLSAALLTDLLEVTGRWVADFVRALDPEAAALFAVAWAGESASTNAFDTAREYTERWHHQMQIRDAVGAAKEPLLAPDLLVPLLETSLRALPHAYRHVTEPVTSSVSIVVRGTPEMAWTLHRTHEAWCVERGTLAAPHARIVGDADSLWRLFYNALPVHEASTRFACEGPPELVHPFLAARSVMV